MRLCGHKGRLCCVVLCCVVLCCVVGCGLWVVWYGAWCFVLRATGALGACACACACACVCVCLYMGGLFALPCSYGMQFESKSAHGVYHDERVIFGVCDVFGYLRLGYFPHLSTEVQDRITTRSPSLPRTAHKVPRRRGPWCGGCV
jgi:hypothetical protein